MDLITNALSRKAMREVKSFLDNLAVIEGEPILLDRVEVYAGLICNKFGISSALNTEKCQLEILSNGRIVGIMTLNGDGFNHLNGIGILYGEAA